ncbi:hypothetical protein [Enterococcus hulanensis]|uniref:hypothetical protein n=1 Tax=Enterococcus hulanensis TaxID=2559929 RepID=UPI0010F65FC1|nr:hypothetical protein [Enterococcus hulanensis]
MRTTLRLDSKGRTHSIFKTCFDLIVSLTVKFGVSIGVFSYFLSNDYGIIESVLFMIFTYIILKLLGTLYFSEWLRSQGDRATRNFFHEENLPNADYNFDSMTKTIIFYCDLIFNEVINLDNPFVQKNIRIICRYMLKHHWEYLNVPNYRFFKTIQIALDDKRIIKEIVKQLKHNHYKTSG